MNMFEDIDECIRLSELALNAYPHIGAIVTSKDRIAWQKKLQNQPDFEAYLCDSKFNILNLTVLCGQGLNMQHTDGLFAIYQSWLSNLNSYLQDFPFLTSNKSFNDKIKNLDNLTFVSTMSELALAAHYRSMGFCVSFETPFAHLPSPAIRRDIDLTIKDNDGNGFHVEVYMPTKQLDLDGFFNPGQDDYHFEYKVGKKAIDKFGAGGLLGVHGKVFLAVNVAFFDMLRVKEIALRAPNNYAVLLPALPMDVSGLLIFTDDFASPNSFNLVQVLEKPE